MSQDITTRKRLESELRAAELRSRLLVERVPAVVYISEPGASGAWHYVSPQLERMLGYTPEEWMADASLWFARIHPDDREFVLDRTVEIMSGEHGQAELQHVPAHAPRRTHRVGARRLRRAARPVGPRRVPRGHRRRHRREGP
ncbi:PAS domain-containing protein [Cellulomonas soli]